MIVTAWNPSVDNLETTYLAQSYNLGITSIEVKNNQQFSANQRVQIGAPGLASTEIVTTGTPSANGTTLPISATLYPHEADAPVYLLQFDQVQVYRSTTGIDGAYTLLATENLDVTNENLQTNYNDLTSVTGYYYQLVMYNSISTVVSSFSDAIPAVLGWARNQVGYLVDQILEEVADKQEDLITRAELIGYFNEVNDDLQMQVVRPYNFLLTRQVFARVAGANSLDYPTTSTGANAMWKFDHMDYNYVDSSTNPVTNNTYTVEVAPSLEYFRNRWIQNSVVSTAILPPTGITLTRVASSGTLAPNTYYFYIITSVNSSGQESVSSTEYSIQTTTTALEIIVSWNAAAGAVSYNIYRGLASGGETILVNQYAGTSYTDTGSAQVGITTPLGTTTQSDEVQEIALNEATMQFDYYPASLTSSSAVWYLYYYQAFPELVSEGDFLITPTPRIYKLYALYKFYLKRSVTEPAYMANSQEFSKQYTMEKMRYKSQDRRDAGTPRRFESEGWVRKSFRR